MTYGYNAAERLTRFEDAPASGAATRASYQYDPFGRRISKVVTQGTTSQTTYYLYADNALMAELDGQGQVTRAYGWDPVAAQSGLWSTEPLWQAEINPQSPQLNATATRYHYLHTDHLSTPMAATDKAGNQTWKSINEAFGQARVDNANAVTINLRLPGQYYDGESGGHYNFHRNYQPETGRYVQLDPIGLEGGLNAFAYVLANPLSVVDPDGLQLFQYPVPRGTYLPRGPAIKGPPVIKQNDAYPSTRSIMNQFTNMPNPGLLPGEYVGINVPWTMPELNRVCIRCAGAPGLPQSCPRIDGPAMSMPVDMSTCQCVQWQTVEVKK